jgi:hypothetical protein
MQYTSTQQGAVALESMVMFDLFYRRFGIRKADQLMAPPLPVLEMLELPKQSILHYTTMSPVESGPASNDYIFRTITRPILMAHITENGDTKGMPRRLTVAVESLIRGYHSKNRRFRRFTSMEAAARDINTLLVFNYGFLPQLYTYVRSAYSEYYKWWNIESAVWKNIANVAAQSDRHHFLMCKLPTVLPSLSDLAIGSGEVSTKMMKIFNTPESLMLLELWKWFGPQRDQSIIAAVPEAQLDKINLIFVESGRWFALNLGVLNKWRKATDEELKANPQANTKGLDAKLMQRRILRLTMSLLQVRLGVAPGVTAAATPAVTEPTVTVQTAAVPTINKTTGVVEAKTKTVSAPTEVLNAVDVEAPSDTADDLKHDEEFEKQLAQDLAELENISKEHVGRHEDEPAQAVVIEEPKTLEDGVMRVATRMAEQGQLSPAELRRYENLSKTYRTLTAPDGKSTLADFIQVPPETLKIPESPAIKDIPTVFDKTMLKSSLHAFDQRYIKEVMARDVTGMVLNVQNAGIAVTNYEVEKVEDVMGAYETHTVRVTPVDGAASTFRFKLPVIEDDGSYMANGIKYRMRKQRGDLPIRKIAPDRVALTSYYGKVFASRSSKRVNDYGNWLRNNIMAMGLDETNQTVTNLQPADVFDNLFEAPRLYSAIAMGFRQFTLKPYMYPKTPGSGRFEMFFDHTKREEFFGKDAMKLEKDGMILIGHEIANDWFMLMDKDSNIHVKSKYGLTEYSTFEMMLNLDAYKAPVEFAVLKVLGEDIPLGVVLGYELGLERLMKFLGVTPRRVPAGQRVNLAVNEYSVVFSDESLVFKKEDRKAALVLGGFNEYHKAIRKFSVYEFDRRGVYLNVLESVGAGMRYLREIDLLYQMFIDPITRDLLIEMKEPTDFRGLLMRCCELLLTDQHPSELDPAFMRIKGYERMAGAVYSEIVRSIRVHNGRAGKSKLPIDLNPYAVWKNISQDPAIAIVSDINPIQNLKETEAVTFSGVGGRNSRSMTKHTRAYHENDMGTISESTVDSSDVAINTYTSADPQFTSLRGISKRYDLEKTGATALLSTSALISPAADRDDPKRVNFIGIQHSHGVACVGYRQSPVRTGYEQVIAHRTSDLFALTAKKPGQVVSVSETGIVVKYDDGEEKGYELGRRFGNAAGLTIPHNVVSEMKAGQKFKEGDLICYNDGFFERDILNPNNVVWKAGIMVKTVLLESTQTLEDASSISTRVANLLTTKMTKVKTVVVNFDQSVRKLVKAGQSVESEDILCTIEDAVTANSGLFDEESLDTLRVLSAQTPQAKAKGVVERIEVFYHGDKQDMSDSLRELANASDRELAKRNKAAGKKAVTGQVDEGFRVDGDPLALDTMAIRIYITSDVPAGVGDKGVFGNQMKTVFSEVMTGEIKTESGKVIDAVFGQKSIADRIVLSPEVMGTTATLLDVIGKKAVAAYKS